MAVKIRLKRMGKIRSPFYRVVVVDARKRRDGRVIEEIGKYNPMEEPSFIEITSDRAQYWLGVGAQPTDQVRNLLQITGDWQKFKGLPGAEGRLKVKAGAEALAAAKADAIKSADAAAEKAKAAASAAKAEAEAAAAAEAAAEAAEDAAEEAAEAPESAGEEA